MPHGHCYFWRPGLLWLQVLSNGFIGAAYVAIAITLAVMVRRGLYLPFKWMMLAFGLFIISCGLTHFFDIVVIWHPFYWVDGSVRALTAFFSVGTALMLPPLVPKALALSRSARMTRARGLELEQALAELANLYDRAKELDALKAQFFASASHDLRAPVTLILGPVERLKSSKSLALSRTALRDLDVIERNAQLLLRHVNDLLDVSRLEAGPMALRYSRVDLRLMTQSMLEVFEGLAVERGLEVRKELPDAPVLAEVDEEKVERVLLNLLANAFRHASDRGVVRARLEGRPDEGLVVLEVADDGPGIRREDRARVFERYVQVGGGARAGASGLGLALVKDFVELHRGRVELDTAPEGGALFRVSLFARAPAGERVFFPADPFGAENGYADAGPSTSDRREGSPPAETPEAGSSPTRRGPVETFFVPSDGGVSARAREVAEAPRVLLAEDEPGLGAFLEGVLASDYRVERVEDGQVALERVVTRPPDLLLTDLTLPGLAGDELVRAVRKRPALEDVGIVVLTGKVEDGLRTRLLAEGVQDYMLKPFSVDELRLRMKNVLATARTRRLLQSEVNSRSRDLEALAREVRVHQQQLRTALDAIEVARNRAEEASRTKTDFMNLVSHELRTPVASLQLGLERLRFEESALSESSRSVLPRMFRQVERLAHLIDSLLEHARIERGRLRIHPQSVDVVALVRSACEELEARAELAGLTLEASASEKSLLLVTDSHLLHLVVVNLLGNAIKYARRGVIRARVDRMGDAARISISDEGPGIPPADRARIFEPFVQLEAVPQKHGPGVGLGLSLVRDLVTALGGEVQVESEVGRGSTFRVIVGAASSDRAAEDKEDVR